jgi:hypothetical protein
LVVGALNQDLRVTAPASGILGSIYSSADRLGLRFIRPKMLTVELNLPLTSVKYDKVLRASHWPSPCDSQQNYRIETSMSGASDGATITYPPEMLPRALAGDEAEVIVCAPLDADARDTLEALVAPALEVKLRLFS